MDWLRENWVSIFIFVVFIAVHLFGHGMHGGHPRQGEQKEEGEHEHHPPERKED